MSEESEIKWESYKSSITSYSWIVAFCIEKIRENFISSASWFDTRSDIKAEWRNKGVKIINLINWGYETRDELPNRKDWIRIFVHVFTHIHFIKMRPKFRQWMEWISIAFFFSKINDLIYYFRFLFHTDFIRCCNVNRNNKEKFHNEKLTLAYSGYSTLCIQNTEKLVKSNIYVQ